MMNVCSKFDAVVLKKGKAIDNSWTSTCGLQKSAFCGMLQNYASNVGPAGPSIHRSPVYGLPEVGGGGSCKP
jgi:hypothetical protein